MGGQGPHQIAKILQEIILMILNFSNAFYPPCQREDECADFIVASSLDTCREHPR